MKFPRQLLIKLFMSDYSEEFSEEGLNILFDSIERDEDESGVQVEFDTTNICQGYKERTIEYIDTVQTILSKALRELEDPEDDDEREEKAKRIVKEYLESYGAFIGFTNRGTVVYRSY